MAGVQIRAAVAGERKDPSVQMRASLSNARDRDALLAIPDAVYLPLEQILDDRVFVAELDGAIVGFAALLPRADGKMELDGLFVEPDRQSADRADVGRALLRICPPARLPCSARRRQSARRGFLPSLRLRPGGSDADAVGAAPLLEKTL